MIRKIANNEKNNTNFLRDCKEIVKKVIDMYDLHDAYNFLQKIQTLNQTPFIVTKMPYFETAMTYCYFMQLDMPFFSYIDTPYAFEELLNTDLTFYINDYCMFEDIVLDTLSRVCYICSKATKSHMFSIPLESLSKLQTNITNWFTVYKNMNGNIKIYNIPKRIDLVYQVLESELTNQNIQCNLAQKTILFSHTLKSVKILNKDDIKKFINNTLNSLKPLIDIDLKGSGTIDTIGS